MSHSTWQTTDRHNVVLHVVRIGPEVSAEIIPEGARVELDEIDHADL